MIHFCSSRPGTTGRALLRLCRRRYSSTSSSAARRQLPLLAAFDRTNNNDCGSSRNSNDEISSPRVRGGSCAPDERTTARVAGRLEPFRSLSTAAADAADAARQQSPPATATTSWTERFDECILRGSLAEAQSLLDENDNLIEVAPIAFDGGDKDELSSSSSSEEEEEVTRMRRGKLLDAWIRRQRELLDEFYGVGIGIDDGDGKEEEQGGNNETAAAVSLRILQDIRDAAEAAHALLERLAPYLGQRMHLLESLVLLSEQQQQQNEKKKEAGATTTTTTRQHLEEPEGDESVVVSDSGRILDDGGGGEASTGGDDDLHRQLHPPPSFDAVLSQRCDAVLEAWAAVVRAYWHYNNNNNNNRRTSGTSPTATSPPARWTRGIPQRAQFLLEQMERRRNDGSSNNNTSNQFVFGGSIISRENKRAEKSVRPTVESYNRVIEAWAYSKEHLRGAMAERVFQSLLKQPKSSLLRPNGESYRNIIWAWALSRDRRAAFTATGHLMKMLRKLEKGDEDMEPTLEDYTVLLEAWSRAEDKMSPGKASSVLRLMEHAHGVAGVTDVQPDMTCYKYVLETAARRPKLPDLGVMVDSILAKMDERIIVPDSTCYSAALRTWKNSALNPDMYVYRERSVRRTLELLERMNVAHQQSSSTEVRVTTDNINDVIEALTVSSNPKRMGQAEALLDSMERSVGVAEPNAHSYRLVLDVWRTSNAIEKVPRAMAILWRLKENYESFLKSASTPGDVVEIFNAFVRVCGSARPRNEKEGTKIFREALEGIEGMRSMDERGRIKPNATSYAALLEACRVLLPLGKERYRVVEQIFHLSCEDGMVDDCVIREFRLAATEEQYSKLVVDMGEIVEGTKMVPEAWTKNALGGRVVTADGRKTKPLSIAGEITITNAMREFQMRRIRDKRNRNLLQGGRLRNREAAIKSNQIKGLRRIFGPHQRP